MYSDETNLAAPAADLEPKAEAPVEMTDEMAEFDKAMSEEADVVPELEIGQLVEATVIDVKKDYVLLDIGDKAEGVVEINEFKNVSGELEVAIGDTAQVAIVGRDSATGQVRLSRRMAKTAGERTRLKAALEAKAPVEGRVKKATKDGLIVDIGLDSFMHRSQIDMARIAPEADLTEWVGKDVVVFITAIGVDEKDSKRSKISVSRRRYMEQEYAKKAEEVIATIEPDIVVTAKVKKHEKFGVFVDLGGIDGLVPASEIAWERGVKPSEALEIDKRYQFKVLSVDMRDGKNGQKQHRISLSRKQIKPDPWLAIRENYPLKSTVKAKVSGIAFNSAYVAFEDGMEGVIPREELSWGTSLKRVEEILKKGAEIEAMVIDYNEPKKQVKLSLRAVTKDPWDELEERFPENSKQTGKVLEVVEYGCFVELDDFTKGLVYKGDFTYDQNDRRKPSEFVKVGDEVEVVVLKIEKEHRRINLGIKQVAGDPFRQYMTEFKEKAIVTGTVTDVNERGARIKLAENVIGFLPVRDWEMERTETLKGVVNVGDSVTAMISKIDKKTRDIRLSRRDMMRDEEKRDREAYTGSQVTSNVGTNLGSLISGLKLNQ